MNMLCKLLHSVTGFDQVSHKSDQQHQNDHKTVFPFVVTAGTLLLEKKLCQMALDL